MYALQFLNFLALHGLPYSIDEIELQPVSRNHQLTITRYRLGQLCADGSGSKERNAYEISPIEVATKMPFLLLAKNRKCEADATISE